MRIIVCLDKSDGMLFNGRRQSMDRAVRKRIFELIGEKPLFMNEYSSGQFEGGNIVVAEDFSKIAEDNYCFVENISVTPFFDMLDEVIIYRWDKKYPADMFFPSKLLNNLKPVCKTELEGNSHKIITEEIYRR